MAHSFCVKYGDEPHIVADRSNTRFLCASASGAVDCTGHIAYLDLHHLSHHNWHHFYHHTTQGASNVHSEAIRKVLCRLPEFSVRGKSGHLPGFIGSESSQHEVDHAYLHGGFTRCRQPLIVLAVPQISSQPGERALACPPPRSCTQPPAARASGPTSDCYTFDPPTGSAAVGAWVRPGWPTPAAPWSRHQPPPSSPSEVVVHGALGEQVVG
jgi:hypothetical protein